MEESFPATLSHRFQIGCCSIAFREQPVTRALEAVAAAGFSAVEIWYPHLDQLGDAELRELSRRCSGLGLAISVIAPYFSFTRGAERWSESLRIAGRVLQIASALGVKKIRTFVDCGPDGLSSGRAKEAHWEAACRGLKELCEMDPSTDFVVETHENTLADTLPSVERLLKDVAKRNLRLNYQATADFLERGYLACIETLFPVIAHMHWEQIRPDGRATYIEEEGLIDFGELIELLTIKGYTGTASVEYCWTPVEAGRVNSAWRHLAGLLSQSKPGASDLLGCGQPGS